MQEEGKSSIEKLRGACYIKTQTRPVGSSWWHRANMSSVPSSPSFGVADDASSVLRAAAADAAEARRLAQMARQTSELVLRQAAQAR